MPAAGRIALHLIRTDGGTQPRSAIVESEVAKYAEMMDAGIEMDPGLVYFDGTHYWLADGFHRLAAARRANFDVIAMEVRQGTQQDAQWASYSANAKHGLPRTNADKRRAVIAAFGHARSAGMSDRALAAHCGVSDHFVGVLRKEFPNCDRIAVGERIGLDGKTRKLPTNKKTQAPAQDPKWPMPNRFGVYAEGSAVEIRHSGEDDGVIALRMLRVGESTWRSTWSITCSVNSLGNAIDVKGETYDSYEEATAGAASAAADCIRDWRSERIKGSQRRELAMLLAWLCTMGAPPDVVEAGPAQFDESSLVIPPPATGESMVLQHYREMQRMRSGQPAPPAVVSADAVQLQQTLSFLARPLDWRDLAEEIGVTDALRAQILQGRDVLDELWRKVVKQLMSA